MARIVEIAGGIEWTKGNERLRIEPWGEHSLRVRSTLWSSFAEDRVGALKMAGGTAKVVIGDHEATIEHGRIACTIDTHSGRLTFRRDGAVILREQSTYVVEHIMPARRLRHGLGELIDIELDFLSDAGEAFWGLGQNPNGALNQKGNHIEFRQRNGIVSIPFAVSSRGYGFFWNNPAIGGVSLDCNRTRWSAKGAHGLDYWITVGDGQKDIVQRYTRMTGLAPKFPSWASGFWQCRLRYATRTELEEVADTHLSKGYPMSVIVIDYFGWSKQGEWKFSPNDFPEPGEMVSKLRDKGIMTMVSIWPSVNPKAENYPVFQDRGLLVRTREGMPLLLPFKERDEDGETNIAYYDATNPEARAYIWERCKANYYDYGVRTWWLDACEPEMYPDAQENSLYWIGAGSATTNAYPYFHAKAFYDGMTGEGEDEVVLLCRSAWAGSQQFGALVWSGDVYSNFAHLAEQIKMGLNMGVSGISWWTTDIGGFSYGKPEDPEFRELLIRWFQFGVFCPVTRLHGNREPTNMMSGAPNELWSFGPECEKLMADQLQVREALRPYVHAQMDRYSADGTPVMRSLAMEFPNDPETFGIEDAYMFGDDYLCAPVLQYGARSRKVYLPKGTDWACNWTGSRYTGGQWIVADAPIERMPVFKRVG